jgi:nucleoside-diphosphate-sugar epimerase
MGSVSLGRADHVVTGATGFVGGHLLARLVDDDQAGTITAVARATPALNATERVLAAIAAADPELPVTEGRILAVEGEITRPDCGVGEAGRGQLIRSAAPLVFWHVAASLEWRPGKRAASLATNVEGSRHAIQLAHRLGADLFVHISTAYVCGTMDGDIAEELHAPAGFNNVYEESKAKAERALSEEATRLGVRLLILRPSIVVGSSVSYRPSGSYTGLYGFITELRRFKATLADSHDCVRYRADRGAILSFIPVDHVIEDALAAVSAELARPERGVYHLTADHGPHLGGVLDYVLDRMELTGRIAFVDERPPDASALERFFAQKMEFFGGYVGSTKCFARSLLPVRSLDMTQMERFIDSELMRAHG